MAWSGTFRVGLSVLVTKLGGDVWELSDTSRAVKPAMQLGPGVFAEIKPVREGPVADPLAPVTVNSGGPDRLGENPRLNMDVAPIWT